MYGELRLLVSVVVNWGVAGSISVEDQSPRTSMVLEGALPVGSGVPLSFPGVAEPPPDGVS